MCSLTRSKAVLRVADGKLGFYTWQFDTGASLRNWHQLKRSALVVTGFGSLFSIPLSPRVRTRYTNALSCTPPNPHSILIRRQASAGAGVRACVSVIPRPELCRSDERPPPPDGHSAVWVDEAVGA